MPVTMFSHMDLSDMDLTGADLTDESVAHSTLTNVKFGCCVRTNFACAKGVNVDLLDVDITDSTFEKAESSVLQSLVGAIWNGQRITAVSDWVVRGDTLYWCFCTDVFVQCGCMQKTMAEWERICQNRDTIKELLMDQPDLDTDQAFDWWQANVATIQAAVAALTQQV